MRIVRSMNLPPPDLPPPPPEPEKKPMTVVTEVAVPTNPYAPPLSPLLKATGDAKEGSEVSQNLGGLIKDAISFPLRHGNAAVLAVGAIVIFFIAIAAYVPLVGLVVMIGGASYVAAYYFEVIEHTVHGKSEAPPWPDLSSYWDDIIVPGIQMLGITLISSVPLILVIWQLAEADDTWLSPPVLIASLLKWIYFPMATLAVVCNGSVWAALPQRVLPSLIRCLPGYLVCAAAFASAEIVHAFFDAFVGWIPIVGFMLGWVSFMYAMLVQARLTGLIYLRYQDRIRWD